VCQVVILPGVSRVIGYLGAACVQVELTIVHANKMVLGKTFKQDQKKVLAALEALAEDQAVS
jgi:hypothetical protein